MGGGDDQVQNLPDTHCGLPPAILAHCKPRRGQWWGRRNDLENNQGIRSTGERADYRNGPEPLKELAGLNEIS